MLVYLGGAIDYATKDQATSWRESTKTYLAKIEISSYDPSKAFKYLNGTGSQELATKLKNINDSAMKHCDSYIFYLPKAINSVGSIVELTELVLNITPNKSVYIVVPDINDISEVSAYLLALIGMANAKVPDSTKLHFGKEALDKTIISISMQGMP